MNIIIYIGEWECDISKFMDNNKIGTGIWKTCVKQGIASARLIVYVSSFMYLGWVATL